MHPRYSIFAICLSCLAGVAQGAAETGHSQHAGTVAAETGSGNGCNSPTALPSILCANTVSAHFEQPLSDHPDRLWLAWSYGGHVYINYSDDLGKSTSPAVAVNPIPEPVSAHGENRPKVVTGPQGNLYVSWTRPLERRFTGHIRFSRSTDGGNHFSDPVTVNDDLSITGHRFDALEVNHQGDIYLAWLDKRDRDRARKAGKEYKGAALYYTLSTDGGASFLPNRKVQDQTCECCRVVMDFDSDGLPVIMWRNIYGDHIRDHALVKFNGRSSPGTPVRVSHDQWRIEACPHHGPSLSIAGDGIYHAVWFNNAPERHGIFYAQSHDQGAHFSEPVSIGDYERNASHAHTLSLGQKVYIVWKEFDGNASHLLLMRSNNAGRQWSDPEIIASTQGDSDHPFLLSNGEQTYISWHRPGNPYALLPLPATIE